MTTSPEILPGTRTNALEPPVDVDRDHVLGPADAEMTLVEFGSYACPNCHAVHEVVEELRGRFGERMRYVFRHLPADDEDATRAVLPEFRRECFDIIPDDDCRHVVRELLRCGDCFK